MYDPIIKQAKIIYGKGFQADAVLFDPETISDRATYQSPDNFPSGIARVLLNGKPIINNGIHTGIKPGRFDFLHR